MMTIESLKDLLCVSHMRWDLVFQRAQHLMPWFAERGNVYFLEEMVFDSPDKPYVTFEKNNQGCGAVCPICPVEESIIFTVICHVATRNHAEAKPFPEATLVLDAFSRFVVVRCTNIFGYLEE